MLFIQTIVPYILQRVSRGGWSEDLRGLIPTNRLRIVNNFDHGESVLRNDDRLRGSARRHLFDRQRRQLLQFSSIDTSQSSVHGYSGDGVLDNATPNNSSGILITVDGNQSNPVSNPSSSLAILLKKVSTLGWNAMRVSVMQAFLFFTSFLNWDCPL